MRLHEPTGTGTCCWRPEDRLLQAWLLALERLAQTVPESDGSELGCLLSPRRTLSVLVTMLVIKPMRSSWS